MKLKYWPLWPSRPPVLQLLLPSAHRLAESKMKATLVNIDVSMAKRRIGLDRLPATVGRSSHADVRLVERCASRVHCEISDLNGTLVVRDLKSRNGTSVNGQYVEQALLLPGDRLTVGSSRFEVQYERRKRRESVSADDGVSADVAGIVCQG